MFIPDLQSKDIGVSGVSLLAPYGRLPFGVEKKYHLVMTNISMV